jgi:hypothetical protein
LPYFDLWVQYNNKDWLAIGYGHERIELLPSIFSSISGPCPLIDEIKPYLRPMSSMTEEERDELEILCDSMSIDDEGNADIYIAILKNHNPILFNTKVIDWFNSHHFDYRGLIEKGLALKAPKGMYNINN